MLELSSLDSTSEMSLSLISDIILAASMAEYLLLDDATLKCKSTEKFS